MLMKKGKSTFVFKDVYLASHASVAAGRREKESVYSKYFDMAFEDDTLGLDSYERAERLLYKTAAVTAMNKAKLHGYETDVMIGGDLLNQITSSCFTARDLEIPFFGLYGACSAICESIMLACMIVSGGFANNVLCAASSHFATAERQFRQPLEMGTPKTPTSQVTVSAAGASVISNKDILKEGIKVECATAGSVVDMGVKDSNNMGGAMAPCCAETIIDNLKDTGRDIGAYDKIITGDLGLYGSEVLYDILSRFDIDIRNRHIDCGSEMFKGQSDVYCGASGCGCAASMLNGYVVHNLIKRKWQKVLFIATGALLSKTSVLQGDSIPCIAHAIVLEAGGRK